MCRYLSLSIKVIIKKTILQVIKICFIINTISLPPNLYMLITDMTPFENTCTLATMFVLLCGRSIIITILFLMSTNIDISIFCLSIFANKLKANNYFVIFSRINNSYAIPNVIQMVVGKMIPELESTG